MKSIRELLKSGDFTQAIVAFLRCRKSNYRNEISSLETNNIFPIDIAYRKKNLVSSDELSPKSSNAILLNKTPMRFKNKSNNDSIEFCSKKIKKWYMCSMFREFNSFRHGLDEFADFKHFTRKYTDALQWIPDDLKRELLPEDLVSKIFYYTFIVRRLLSAF